MLSNIKNTLTSLGLKDSEVAVYLCCLQTPFGLFVHEITKQTEIKRSTIDLILQRLRKQGFITRHKEGRRWVYCAEAPEKIAFSLDEKLSDFKSSIPALLEHLQNGETPNIRHYEGTRGLEQIFDDILLCCQRLSAPENEVLIMSSGRDLIRLLPKHQTQFIQKRVRRNIPTRVLAPDTPISQKLYPNSTTMLRQTRFFDEATFPFSVEMDIYADKVAIMTLQEPKVMGTIIQSRAIAQSMRSLFNMLWHAQNQKLSET